MANTVNDVMNVIANPDYGIKNIAGTNQEILAILQGTHNSKNNIYTLVNDVKNLLQELVDVSTKNKNKPVEVKGTSTKINQRHIQDILDETKGIRKAIDNLSKALLKQKNTPMPTIAKLSDKASEKVANAMLKSMDKQNNGSGLTSIIDTFSKLKNISLKDITFGKLKMNLIKKTFKDVGEDLNIDKKDFENIIKLINAAPEMIKSLSKINWRINKIIKNNIIKKLSDILIGEKNSILSLSILLNKNKKDLDNASKVSKSVEILSSSLSKSIFNLFFASLFAKKANKGVKSIDTAINKLITLSGKLVKNKKDLDEASKVSKKITILSGNLLATSIFLSIIAVTGIPARWGANALSKIVNKIIPIAKKLTKNNKEISKSVQAAKTLMAFTGLMAVSSLFLATIAATGVFALLGAKLLSKIVNKIIPISKKLVKNNKEINKSVKSASALTAFTGLMAVTSLFLATIAVTGVPALLGSVLMLGIVKITSFTFKILNKAKKNILIGSIAMVIMSTSLILFGIALNKITEATKGVSFKQVGVIATLTLLLGGTIALLGIPAVFPFIALGSLSMAIMGIALIPFGIALGKISSITKGVNLKQISKISATTVLLGGTVALLGMPLLFPNIMLGSISMAVMSLALIPFSKALSAISKQTEKLKMKQITLVSGSMYTLGMSIAGLALLSVPVLIGSITLGKISKSLLSFTKTLKAINSIGSIPNKQIYQVLKAIKSIGDFFKENKLKKKVIKTARRYKRMLRPFMVAAQHIAKLKEIGVVPMKLVYQTLNTLRAISNYYIENPIRKKAIKQAKRYMDMLKPFGKALKHLTKLKELGVIPIKLVYQTLNAIGTIANYYKKNPIREKAIKQAKRYRDILKPFGKTLKYLTKLKELGIVPMKLVYQTLDAIRSISNYYIDNPIRKKAIRQAKIYKKILRPFGKTIKYLSKLKELGTIPLKLVHQAMTAMTTIANYYIENPIKKKVIKQAKRYKKMLSPFGNTIKYLSKLKDLGSIPMKLVYQTLNAISAITDFYKGQDLSDFDEINTRRSAISISGMISSFGKSVESLKPLKGLGSIPIGSINNIIEAANKISLFYNTSVLSDNVDEKSKITEFIVNKFSNMVMNIQDKFENIKTIDFNSIISATYAFNYIFKYYRQNIFKISKNKMLRMSSAIKLFAENANFLKDNIQGFTKSEYINTIFATKSMKRIINLLRFNIITKKAQRNMMLIKEMSSIISSISNISSENITSVGDAISNTLNGISTSVDMSKLQAVTNMFNAFNGINKSESIINKFTKSVKEFTETCKNLIDAMNSNADAINNIENSGDKSIISEIRENNIIERRYNDNSNNNRGIRISNVDEIAKTIAEKINGALSVDMPDTQVQLLINGIGGNEWTITRY